eukprot:gnl/TRDRNA2_/TRDRNA2_59589_c0_seq1.p1 gnl/TRDRNA2_/TRDRNA2_59589_c0~~gnl/TRDRNA2_/TRDRNA2_59589_c0_seq1.p1  ORF type:complete len:657 (-),score=103.88 gnl/TRDRNA2_/TRDRNA2_59589_c0_seq1:75-2045(-)
MPAPSQVAIAPGSAAVAAGCGAPTAAGCEGLLSYPAISRQNAIDGTDAVRPWHRPAPVDTAAAVAVSSVQCIVDAKTAQAGRTTAGDSAQQLQPLQRRQQPSFSSRQHASLLLHINAAIASSTTLRKRSARALPLIAFSAFLAVLSAFAFAVDVLLVVTVRRAQANGRSFSRTVMGMNYCWIIVQMVLIGDLAQTILKRARRRKGSSCISGAPNGEIGSAGLGRATTSAEPVEEDDEKLAGEDSDDDDHGDDVEAKESEDEEAQWRSKESHTAGRDLQRRRTYRRRGPNGRCSSLFRVELTPLRYLMLLSILLPLNTLLFYGSIGSPVLTASRLEGRDIDSLVQNPEGWLQSDDLLVDPLAWTVAVANSTRVFVPLDPPLTISSKECYSYDSVEFYILGRLIGEETPKQVYCESLIGTMMAQWRAEKSSATWQHSEDVWEEAWTFSVRLFGSLAGLVADQSTEIRGGGFLKDMTDVFDMYMLTFVDIEQMHQGRPLLAGRHGVEGVYQRSYHDWVFVWLFLGYATVLLRALSVLGFEPCARLMRWCCCPQARLSEVRGPAAAMLPLVLLELPFLGLRWIAWHQYGVSVSVMAVKNVFGIYEKLQLLGVIPGLVSSHRKRRTEDDTDSRWRRLRGYIHGLGKKGTDSQNFSGGCRKG